MVRHSIALVIVIIATAACSPKQPEMQALEASGDDSAARAKTVIDDQLKALDKAKALQEALDQQKVDSDKAIEDAGG
jgi:predicted  nucleic acid-binding Zn-ribbon protein